MGKNHLKPHQGASLEQEALSKAKRDAQLSRDMHDACDALRCVTCPYTDVRCRWVCALAYARTKCAHTRHVITPVCTRLCVAAHGGRITRPWSSLSLTMGYWEPHGSNPREPLNPLQSTA